VTDPSPVDTAAGFTEVWSVTKNGAAFASGSGTNFGFTPDDNGTYVVTLSATDKDGGTGTATATIPVFNVAPAASLSGPADGVRGQARTFTLGASDPSPVDQAAGFTYQIAWGDGSTQAAGPSGVTLDHVYTDSGAYTVQVTATDKDGGTSAVVSQAVTIHAVALQGTTLVVGGTTGDDVIRFERHGHSAAIDVTINGASQGSFTGVTGIIAYGQAGNDYIAVSHKITASALLFGGDGNDVLQGGGGNDVLVGGGGYNVLLAGSGRDVLIGGGGTNVLLGQGGDDLLIAGSTSFDSNVAALLAVLAEWSSDRDYLTRIANLTGTGSGANFTNRLNGNYFLLAGQTVFADAGGSVLVGGPGQDWFFAGLADFVVGRRKDETLTLL
jgi:Ca2+-binding RTX toxin-like protein